MNGIEKITEKILGDAQAEAAAILADAKKEADGIVASYQAEADEQKQKLAEAAQVQAAEQERRIISSAELDARKAILARKQALIAQAFDATKKKITTMDEPSYIDFLCTLAAQSVLDGKEEVVLSAEDSQKFGQKVVDGANKILQDAGKVGELTLSNENRPIVGLVLKGRDLEVNCALDTVINLLKDDLSAEVAKALLN